MCYTVILLLLVVINNCYGMKHVESGYGSISHNVALQDSNFWHYGKKSITCARLLLPMLLVSIPPLVGFITSSIRCTSNNSENTEHHQRIGQLLQELLTVACANGTV